MNSDLGEHGVGREVGAPDPEQQVLDALSQDPPAGNGAPAQTLPQAIPSGGVNLNAILYTAAGPGPHPTVLLLHGLPGNEQNIDLAQTLRRAGWNVLAIHYRGSWGGSGTFSFDHCLEDAGAALDWIRDRAGDAALKLDARRTVVIGHSMGGFVAAHLLAERLEVQGGVMISGVDLPRSFGNDDRGQAAARVDQNVGIGAGLHILAGTSAQALAEEARSNADRWRLTNYAGRLADRPLLMVTSDDGFASGGNALTDAIQRLSASQLAHHHFSTDHSYSDCRIGLQTAILLWLRQLQTSGADL